MALSYPASCSMSTYASAMRSSAYGNAPSASLPPLASSDGIGPSPAPGMSGAQIGKCLMPCSSAVRASATAHWSHMRWSTGNPCTSTTGMPSPSRYTLFFNSIVIVESLRILKNLNHVKPAERRHDTCQDRVFHAGMGVSKTGNVVRRGGGRRSAAASAGRTRHRPAQATAWRAMEP